jgi:hypothetical protein
VRVCEYVSGRERGLRGEAAKAGRGQQEQHRQRQHLVNAGWGSLRVRGSCAGWARHAAVAASPTANSQPSTLSISKSKCCPTSRGQANCQQSTLPTVKSANSQHWWQVTVIQQDSYSAISADRQQCRACLLALRRLLPFLYPTASCKQTLLHRNMRAHTQHAVQPSQTDTHVHHARLCCLWHHQEQPAAGRHIVRVC